MVTDELTELDNFSHDDLVSPAWTAGTVDNNGAYDNAGTHEYITAVACNIMFNDRGFWGDESSFSAAIMLYISLASLMLDTDETEELSAGHFYDPDTGKNWKNDTVNTARNNAQNRYNTALVYARAGNIEMAYEYLGRCLHYIQDLNVPHHSANVTVLNLSHVAFESYAEDVAEEYLGNYNSVGVNNYDYYPANNSVGEIAHLAAHYSKQRIDYVDNLFDQSEWANQARIGLRNAARYSVMVLYKFALESPLDFYEN